MAFIPSRQRTVHPPRRVQVVLAVGQRVFINRPTDTSHPISLTDDRGVPATTALSDGAEVEIIAWRPRGSTGTRYRVRNHSDGSDGWLAANELRATAVRPASAPVSASEPAQPPTTAAPSQRGGGRPFGSWV